MNVRLIKRRGAYTLRLSTRAVERAGLQGPIEIHVQDGCIVLRKAGNPRAGWADACREMALRGDDQLIDGELPPLTSFDLEEWQW